MFYHLHLWYDESLNTVFSATKICFIDCMVQLGEMPYGLFHSRENSWYNLKWIETKEISPWILPKWVIKDFKDIVLLESQDLLNWALVNSLLWTRKLTLLVVISHHVCGVGYTTPKQGRCKAGKRSLSALLPCMPNGPNKIVWFYAK